MANDERQARTFTKKVGDETRTRTVYTNADAVQATYDGFTEKTSKSSSSSGSSGSSTSGSKSSGSSSS